MKKETYTDLLILTLIVSIGAVLRFYDLFEIPMMHDELSALSRLSFSTFSELIEKGVKVDGHPAGVQVFLFYWTKFIGNTDSLIKLPFLLFGVGSIVLSYFISKKWFNSTSALIISSFIATLQFPIMYSQIARPYISGLFFSLLMVLCWTNFLFNSNSKKLNTLYLVGFTVSASICCYNHHFSLLFAFMVCVTGLFFLKKEKARSYLFSLAAIAVLYLPHLRVFFHQLNNKGLDWLSTPQSTYILDHVGYIFHFNPIVYITVFGIICFGIYKNKEPFLVFSKFRVISICWFLIPISIGLIYSIVVKPVIQHSVLLFSFPYLLFFLFSFQNVASIRIKSGLTALVLVVNITSLVVSREHYTLFYKQPYNSFAQLTHNFTKQNSKTVTLAFNENPNYINHYFSKANPHLEYISLFNRNLSPIEFRKKIETNQTDYFISGNLEREYISIVREFYPCLVFREFGYTYDYYIFSKRKETHASDIIFSDSLTFDNTSVYSLDSTTEWGENYEIELTQLTQSHYDYIDIAFDFKNTEPNGLMVCEILKNNERINWQASLIQNFHDSAKADDWQRAYLSFSLVSIFKNERDMSDCKLNLYFWNKDKKQCMLKNVILQCRTGNTNVYSLFMKTRVR